MKNELEDVLDGFGLEPVLADVGASAGAPAVWTPIAGRSVYVGFDPDARLFGEVSGGVFRKALTVPKAIVAGAAGPSARVNLTHSPYCSSTLEPDLDSLKQYAFWRMFQVERQVTVACSTLEAALDEHGIGVVHWLKTDTQGTDLSVLRSLGQARLAGLLAVDLEPGLIPAYRGEESFAEVHAEMSRMGFWLSRMDVCGSVRIGHRWLEELAGKVPWQDAEGRGLGRIAPGWVEVRYLRTSEHLENLGASLDQWILAWVVAMLDEQPAFAYELAAKMKSVPGGDSVSLRLSGMAVEAIRRRQGAGRRFRLVHRVLRAIGRRTGLEIP